MIDLYTARTPNGQKASIMLEEIGAAYTVHKIDITKGDQFATSYLRISPNSKIPAIVDNLGPKGRPITIMESGAILIYLAEKYNLLLPKDPELKSLVIQWLFFQIGHIGPMFGQFGHFYRYGRDHCDHPYPIERYTKESKRLLGVLETQLSATSNCIAGEYSIADIAILPWVNCLEQFYNAGDLLALNQYQALRAWQSRLNKREAVQKGSDVGK